MSKSMSLEDMIKKKPVSKKTKEKSKKSGNKSFGNYLEDDIERALTKFKNIGYIRFKKRTHALRDKEKGFFKTIFLDPEWDFIMFKGNESCLFDAKATKDDHIRRGDYVTINAKNETSGSRQFSCLENIFLKTKNSKNGFLIRFGDTPAFFTHKKLRKLFLENAQIKADMGVPLKEDLSDLEKVFDFA